MDRRSGFGSPEIARWLLVKNCNRRSNLEKSIEWESAPRRRGRQSAFRISQIRRARKRHAGDIVRVSFRLGAVRKRRIEASARALQNIGSSTGEGDNAHREREEQRHQIGVLQPEFEIAPGHC
jgi:hypothetical protein